ncbi:hypothetical protein Ataiwa_16430 [Algoriphagus taiwanensis]|uniref:Uncharacterized protein n=1 Tax=Algoriphagus taiwanensis TaxID=1445656 RepID=A0ABQ6PZJ3_9BACT|nr:hypothetical protein Ataiwa_16430 [Algoriphagus taiwanensis]
MHKGIQIGMGYGIQTPLASLSRTRFGRGMGDWLSMGFITTELVKRITHSLK